MIGFLLGRRWRDRGRLLFHFHDGRRRRSADPLVVWQSLESHPRYRHSRDFAEAMAGDEGKQAAALAAVCDAFGIEPYGDGRGMTITERLGLLAEFDRYATQLRAGLGFGAIGRKVQRADVDDSSPAPAAEQPAEVTT